MLGQVDELLSELDREARREEHRERQQRKRIFRTQFNVHDNEDRYQIEGGIPGFEQENLEIEVTDENTLRVAGNTEKRAEQPQSQSIPALETKTIEAEAKQDDIEEATLNEPEQAASGAATPTHSDTESHKSHQATVEDDFEDLGAETASTLSAGSNEPKEPKGKERAVEQPLSQQPSETPVPRQESPMEDCFIGSFERTFRFPERIDAGNVRASLRNGVLSITVPKARAPEVRRILIQ